MSDVIDEHRLYLTDPHRLNAYQEAIEATVRPGDVVLDLGAGSGILGLIACRAGARKVYAIESTSLIERTRAIARQNGYQDRIEHIRGHSLDTVLPELVDVVICDQVGRFGFEAGILEYFADAARRLAKPDARFVPGRIRLQVAPVQHTERSGHVSFWSKSVLGFDMSPLGPIAQNSGYPTQLEREHLLGPAADLTDLETTHPAPFQAQTTIPIERAGRCDGLGAWFVSELAPGIQMTSSPLDPARIQRRNTFFPLGESVSVEPGDRLETRFKVIPKELVVAWQVDVYRGADPAPRHRFRHSTFEGLLIAPEDIERTQPDFKPTLSQRGQARGLVVHLCDGQKSIREIEETVWGRFPGLFESPRAAAGFVADVVTRYAP